MNLAPGDLLVLVIRPERISYATAETLYDRPTYYTATDITGYVKEDNVSMCIATHVETFSQHTVKWAYIWTDDGQFGWTIVTTRENEENFKVVS